MSSAKYTTKLVADTSQHDKAIGKSKQQVYNYQKGIENFTGKVKNGAVSALSKFAVGVGAGVTALEALDKIVKSSQTTSDKWDATMRVCTTTVNSFFTAIGTGDFSYFTMGLDTIITKAKATQTALDELGNSKISFGYFNSKNQSDLAEALTIAKDKTKSQSERDEATKRAQEIIKTHTQQVQSLNTELQEALSALATERNRLQNITVEEFSNILAIDLLPQQLKDNVKAELTKQYKEYIAEVAKIEQKHTHQGVVGTTSFGMAMYSTTVNHAKVNEEVEQSGLNEQYRKAILYNEMLVRQSDEQLQNATNLAIEYNNNNKALSQMERQLLEVTNQTATVATTTKTALVGSIAEIEQRISDLKVEAQYTTDTATYQRLQNEIAELENEKILLHVQYVPQNLKMAGLPTAENPLESLPTQLEQIPMVIQPVKENLVSIENQAYTTATAIGAIGDMFTTIGNASNDAGAKTLKVMGVVSSSISQLIPQIVALSSAKEAEALSSGVASASKVPYPGNLLAITSIVATLISTFSQIKSITGYANGGVFTGKSTIGDLNLAKVNKGEMILNGTQQSRLFKLLNSNITTSTNNSFGSGEVKLRISGGDLVAVLNTQNNKSRRVI